MTTGTDGFFTMQGIERHVSRFKAQLDMPNTLAKNRHILIRGPRGSGKSYFLDIFKDHIHSSNPPVRLNCAAINADLADSELFGHVAGAYTDAKKDNEGFIKTASNSGKVLILEEFEPDHAK